VTPPSGKGFSSPADTQVVQRRESARLPVKVGQPCGILADGFWKDLDGDFAVQTVGRSAVDLIRPPASQRGQDLVGAKL
jgi:hypothetical protein